MLCELIFFSARFYICGVELLLSFLLGLRNQLFELERSCLVDQEHIEGVLKLKKYIGLTNGGYYVFEEIQTNKKGNATAYDNLQQNLMMH